MTAGVLPRPEAEKKGVREMHTPAGPGRPGIAAQRLAGARAALAAGDVALAQRLLLQAIEDMAAEDKDLDRFLARRAS